MGDRALHAFDLIDDRMLHRAACVPDYDTERELRKLFEDARADVAQHCECRAVRQRKSLCI